MAPVEEYRSRRALTWRGGITKTSSPASSMASTSGPSGRSIPTASTPSFTSRLTRPAKDFPVFATSKRARITPSSSTTHTACALVAQSMPASLLLRFFTFPLPSATIGAPSVSGRLAGCSLRGDPCRASLVPVLAPRPVGARRSHAGPRGTSDAGGAPTVTEGSSRSLPRPLRRSVEPRGGCTNERRAGHLRRDVVPVTIPTPSRRSSEFLSSSSFVSVGEKHPLPEGAADLALIGQISGTKMKNDGKRRGRVGRRNRRSEALSDYRRR